MIATLPVAFAQVREDALLDLWLAERVGPQARVLMVASGGCTAAALAASGQISGIHLVDPNPAQIALTRLKLRLLRTTGLGERLALLGHAPMPDRADRLVDLLQGLDLDPDVLGPADYVAQVGPDHAGRYERLFAELRAALGERLGDFEAVLRLCDLDEQSRRVAPDSTLGRALDDAFDNVLTLEKLTHLFGPAATANRAESFASHFARRTRHVLATLPAASNPYLWQMWTGAFPPTAVTPWLTATTPGLPEITWTTAAMDDALTEVPAGQFDLVHLSNILDWLEPAAARHTLALATAALRPGGWVIIRQLNSTLVVQESAPDLLWDSRSVVLHARDRSFFYRRLHLGRKR